MTIEHITNPAIATAQAWAVAAADGTGRAKRSANQLARLVADPAGLDLAVDFVDRVARPEDARAAATALRSLDTSAASFLSPIDRGLLGAGSAVATLAPRIIVPAARARLRQLVGHLVVDADDNALTRHIATMLQTGYRLNLNLLGEAVLGEAEAISRTERTRELLRRPDVDYVSVKVSSLVSQISTWDTPAVTARVVERLRPLLREAAQTTPRKFVNLDMEEYRDLALTVGVFEELLAEPELMHLSAGIVLQAYLPDSVDALTRLIAFARARVQAGGAPIKVRLVKGANLAMERVEAELHGWTQAPYETKADVDANYLRLIDMALRPEIAYAMRLGVASHNLFHVAFARELAVSRGVEAALDVEMLHGMAPAEAAAIQRSVANPIVLYTPVVAKPDFDVAISYLVRRLEEAAAPENYLHDHFRGSLAGQQAAFVRALQHVGDVSDVPRRSATRAPAGVTFRNTSDSDPALAEIRDLARTAVELPVPESTIPVLEEASDVDRVVEAARGVADAWAAYPAAHRADVLRTIADELEQRRTELVGVMAAEAGKTVAEAAPEVAEAIDYARFYAEQAIKLEKFQAHQGVTFAPDRVVLVTPPWNFPVAIPLGGVFAALAAGSAVIVKPAPQTPLCAQVGMEAIAAGLAAHGEPAALAQIVSADEQDVGRALVTHDDVDTVILTGALATAELFTSWRVDRERGPRILAETSGKNAIIVTPSADVDLAVADVVSSAFSHAGQKCSAASLIILVGSVATSRRFRRQLLDAVTSLSVDWPANLSASVGPLIAEPTGKLARALTELAPGEEWLVEPVRIDERLWRPGVKTTSQGSEFHLTEYFGPVLGVLTADNLEQAIELQNATQFGLTGGIHSLDPAEVDQWLAQVEVGNAYINRHITGAIVQRQSFGGWKSSSVGPGAKAGGPHYLSQLGTFTQVEPPRRASEPGPRVAANLDLIRDWLTESEWAFVEQSVVSDGEARDWYRTPRDRSGLLAESNVLRHRRVPNLALRAGERSSLAEVLRIVLAAQAAGAELEVSIHPAIMAALPEDVREAWDDFLRDPEETISVPAGSSESTGAAGESDKDTEGDEATPDPVDPDLDREGDLDLDLDGDGEDGVVEPEGPDPRILAAIRLLQGWQVETLDEFTIRASTWTAHGRLRLLDSAETVPVNQAISTLIAVIAGPALQSGRRELLTFLREQAISRTEHRFGHVPAERAAAVSAVADNVQRGETEPSPAADTAPVVVGGDMTVPVGDDETDLVGDDETEPSPAADTAPDAVGDDMTVPVGDDETDLVGDDETEPSPAADTAPDVVGDDETDLVSHDEGEAVEAVENKIADATAPEGAS